MKTVKIPEATIMRLSLYSIFLKESGQQGIEVVSSGEIAAGVGVSSAMVRKDLAYFGEFGTRGVGYRTDELNREIIRILGLNREWPVVLIGAGKLGSALVLYDGFVKRGFHIVGAFDNDPARIGNKLGKIVVSPISQLEDVIRRKGIEMAIITVLANVAQDVADRLVAAGVKAVLNFSSTVLIVPEQVIVQHVDFSMYLGVLSFNLTLNND